MTILLSFAALVPRILLGFFIVHFVWGAMDGRSLLVKVFLSAGVGFGISSLLSFLWIWAGLPLITYVVAESAVSVFLTFYMIYSNRAKLHFQKSIERPDSVWVVILFAGIIIFALNLVLYALQNPHGRPDAWSNWNVVARFVYLGGANWQGTFLRQWDHPDYPLFLAMTNAITWAFLHNTSTWGPIAFHFTLSFFTAGLLFSLVNLFRDHKQAIITTVLFISLPFIIDQGMRQYADLLLAYLILAAGGLTLLYLQTKESRLAILVGFLIGLGGWTKNEGIMAIVGLSVVWILLAYKKEQRPAFQNYLIGLAFPLFVIVLFKAFLAPSNDLLSTQGSSLDKLLDVERYKIIFKTAIPTLWNLGGTPLSIIGLIILTAILMGRHANRIPGMWTVGVVIGLQLVSYFGIFLLTSSNLTWHLNTSLDRLYLHVLPLTFLWLFLWLRSPQELLPKES